MADELSTKRASFLPPIPDLAVAVDLLASAADSLLSCNDIDARSYLDAANMPTLRAYTRSIMAQTTRNIHDFRPVPNLSKTAPPSGPRQPSASMALNIYRRDGFRCRYCGCRIIFPQAQNIMSDLLPGAVRWGSRDVELNAAFYTLKGVLDHVVPYAHGGSSEPANMVTSCQPCNYGKGQFFLEEFGLSDPRLRPPKIDGWDGLLRLLPLRLTRTRTRTEAAQLRTLENSRTRLQKRQPAKPRGFGLVDEFASSFNTAERQHLGSILQSIESCADIGAFWTLRQVLMVKVPTPTVTLSILGIEADATVQVPWFIGPYKQESRSFAETLAAALPGGTACETEKMWRVRCFGRVPRISDLAQDPAGLRQAFLSLDRALRKCER